MKRPFILTFGSCGLDRIFEIDQNGKEKFIYEEEGKKNSHQAIAAKRAGADSMLVSFVGDDDIGTFCLESLKKSGIDTSHVQVVAGEKTELNYQYLDPITKDYALKRCPSTLSQNYTAEMAKTYESYILKADCVVMVTKQPHDFIEAIINTCFLHKIPTALTVSHDKFYIDNAKDLNTLKKVSFIACNFEESERLTKKQTPEEMLQLLPNMLITSSNGVWFTNENGKFCFEKSVPAQNIVETNGAGDTFIGNFIVYQAEGKSKTESVRRAMCASTLEIQKMGVLSAMPYREEVDELYNCYYNLNKNK